MNAQVVVKLYRCDECRVLVPRISEVIYCERCDMVICKASRTVSTGDDEFVTSCVSEHERKHRGRK